jgi:outer membrane cobalamin receptor
MQAGLHYRPRESQPGVGFSYATGFKPPSLFALGHPLVGNVQLKPEQSRTVELAIASDSNTTAARPIAYRAAVFHSAYENLVDFDAGPPPRLVNRSEVEIKGYEAAVSARVSDSLNLRAGATGLSFALPEGTPDLRNRPRFRATASAAYSVTPHVTASLYGSWVGRIFDSSVPTGSAYLPPYPLFDASLAFGARDMQIVIAVDNMLDRHFQQFIGFPSRGRRVRLEVSFGI